jgi:hypothetical protein
MMSEADSDDSLPIMPFPIMPSALCEFAGAGLLFIVQAESDNAAIAPTATIRKDFLLAT